MAVAPLEVAAPPAAETAAKAPTVVASGACACHLPVLVAVRMTAGACCVSLGVEPGGSALSVAAPAAPPLEAMPLGSGTRELCPRRAEADLRSAFIGAAGPVLAEVATGTKRGTSCPPLLP